MVNLNFLSKLIGLLQQFFQITDVEYGNIVLMSSGNLQPQEVFVATESPVERVWLSVHSQGHQVCGAAQTFVSECTPVSGGFSFSAIVASEVCHIQWMAIIGGDAVV